MATGIFAIRKSRLLPKKNVVPAPFFTIPPLYERVEKFSQRDKEQTRRRRYFKARVVRDAYRVKHLLHSLKAAEIALIQLASNAISPANHLGPPLSRLIILSSHRAGAHGAMPFAR